MFDLSLVMMLGAAAVLLLALIYREWRYRQLQRKNLELIQNVGEAQRTLTDHGRELRGLFEHAAISVMVFDRYDRKIRYANDLALDIFGVGSQYELTNEVMYRPDAWAEAPYSLREFETWLDKAGKLGVQRFEWKALGSHGHPVWLDATLAATVFDGQQALMFTGINISDRKISQSTDWLRNRTMVAMTGDRPLSATLDLIVAMYQFTAPQARCGIMVMDSHTQTLNWGTEAGFAEPFHSGLQGLPIRYGAATCGTAASIQGRVVTEDIEKDERWDRYRPLAQAAGVQACWSEPILGTGGEVLGTFAVYHDMPWKPSEEDVERLTGPLYLASLAIERHRSRESLKRLVAAEKSIRQISVKLQSLDAESTDGGVQDVLKFLCEYLNIEQVYAFERDQANALFSASHCWPPVVLDEDEEPLALTQDELSDCLATISSKKYCELRRDQSDEGDELLDLLMADEAAENALIVPVILEDRIDGLLIFCTRDASHRWEQLEINTATPIAALIGSALHRKSLVEALTHQALHDRLTDLFNRGKMEDQLRQEINRASRYGNEFSLILFDVDHFKNVNDRFGHNAGDDVLVEVARLLKENVRSADVVGRWGGEEFLVVLPETDLARAGEVAETLRMHISRQQFPIPGGVVTVSAGVSSFLPGETAQELVKRADDALYHAKENGRNRVKMSA